MANSAQDTHSVEYHLVTLFEKLDALRHGGDTPPPQPPMQAEVRTLEFWRSIISECLASFFYVFVVCGAAAAGGAGSQVLLTTAIASGFAVATVTQCFGHVSGEYRSPLADSGIYWVYFKANSVFYSSFVDKLLEKFFLYSITYDVEKSKIGELKFMNDSTRGNEKDTVSLHEIPEKRFLTVLVKAGLNRE